MGWAIRRRHLKDSYPSGPKTQSEVFVTVSNENRRRL
jgi:hypothetical protein